MCLSSPTARDEVVTPANFGREASALNEVVWKRGMAWSVYLVATGVTLATIGFRLAIDSPLEGKTTLVLFILPVMLSAYLGGLGAGLLATALSGLWGAYHLHSTAPGAGSVAASSWWNLFFFLVGGSVISLLNEALHRSRWRAGLAVESHKQAERRLKVAMKESQDLRLALDQHAIVAITAPSGEITFVNDAFCEVSQYARGELLGMDHRMLNSGYHSREFFRELWETITRRKVWKGELRNRARDGSFYWIATTIVPFSSVDGRSSQYVAVGTDITEQKRAEGAAAHLAAVAAFSDDAIMSVDLDGVVTSWNAGAEKIFGYTPEEMIGTSTLRFIPEDRHAEEEVILKNVALGKSLRDFETVRVRKDGSLVDLAVTVSPVRNAAGQIIGAAKVSRDITERKKAAEIITRLNVELEDRVKRRTAELEFANRELESFSYSVSHDLRAPLRAVDGFSQAVLEDFGPQLPEEGQRYLRTIRQGAQQMGTLIDDLLTFSRFSRAPLRRQKVWVEGMVHAVWQDLGVEKSGRKIDVRVGELPVCDGDPALLREVWINLLSNAVKYTRKREKPVIEIGSIPVPDGQAYFVRDNGTGFDMRYAGKLFGVFQRLHRTEDYEGMGVGLALVQRIIHRHGGRIWAEAEVERGAAFYFTTEGSTSL